ncbi:hypothetical protein [Sinorhizobium fredii]|uniref:hypothetical protein n=1 Tax=Rhizobium fredii TaxID=380 RepID=UPI0035118EDC
MNSALPYRGLKIWIGTTTARFPTKPPYAHDLKVTILSTFGLMVWEIPAEDFPPGSQNDRWLDFLKPVHIGKARLALVPADVVLVQQLKELVVAFMFKTATLGEIKKAAPKARSVVAFFTAMRRLFVGLKWLGLRSLGELNGSNAERILSVFDCSPKARNEMVVKIIKALKFAAELLISGAEQLPRIQFKRSSIVSDTSKETGVQALNDDELSQAISASRFYFDNFNKIEVIWQSFNRGELSRKDMAALLSKLCPVLILFNQWAIEEQIGTTIKAAGINLFGWHLGARISEILSAKVGFIVPAENKCELDVGKVSLALTTRKAVAAVHGMVRNFEVHPFLARVARVLERVRDLEGNLGSEHLFTGARTGKVLANNNVNRQLEIFSHRHGIRAQMSSHVWRNTLVSVTVRAVDQSLGPLCQYLGHEHVSTTVGYAVTNPFVRDDLNKAISQAMSDRVDRFLDKSINAPQSVLRGGQGAAFLRNTGAGTPRHSASQNHIKEELVSGRVSLTHVAPGVDCLKHPLARGLCARGKGGLQFDTEACDPECAFRLETPLAAEELQRDIDRTRAFLTSAENSTLMKIRWAADITSRLRNWPELKRNLVALLDHHSSLWMFFQELRDA